MSKKILVEIFEEQPQEADVGPSLKSSFRESQGTYAPDSRLQRESRDQPRSNPGHDLKTNI